MREIYARRTLAMEETRSAKKAATAVASPISHLANLSPDEFDEILKRLHINDRQRLACCCKSLDVAVATSFVWRDLSFGKSPLLVSSVAKWMSDASLARLLRKVGPQVERVSLEGCGKSLTGTGLSPLKGSRTLVQADVRCKGLDGPRVTLILQTMLAPECRLSSVLSFKGCKVHGKVVKVNSPSRGCLGPEFASNSRTPSRLGGSCRASTHSCSQTALDASGRGMPTLPTASVAPARWSCTRSAGRAARSRRAPVPGTRRRMM